MKFLLDMGLARSTCSHLRGQGHDAVHLREQGLQKLDDHAVVDKARLEGRVILTHDLGFGRIIAVGQDRVPSVITFRLADMRPGNVNAYLEDVLAQCSLDLEAGALVSVGDHTIRVRRLPIAGPPGSMFSQLSCLAYLRTEAC